jgi:short-subunit dehydrogenase
MLVASTAAFQPGPQMAVYSASKAYVLSFGEAIAFELEGKRDHAVPGCQRDKICGSRQGFRLGVVQGRLVPVMSASEVGRPGCEGLKARRPVVVT